MFAGWFIEVYLLKKVVVKIVSVGLIFRRLNLVKHKNKSDQSNLYSKPIFYLRAFHG